MPDPLHALRLVHLRRDTDRGSVRRLLSADFHAQNLGNLRRILVHVVAGGGVLSSVFERTHVPVYQGVRGPLTSATLVLGALAAAVGTVEAFWVHRRSRLADDLSSGGPPEAGGEK